jgi:predicted O-linked N-acetylglucosamine transferase (SPINDLY family)
MSQLTIDQALRMVLRHREAGRPTEADGIYRQIVAQLSGQAETLHWLGLRACEDGHLDLAIDLIGRAIAVDPSVGGYHSNLGECYRRAGESDQAIQSLRRAVELAPGLLQAHYNLGVVLKAGGRLDEAIHAYRRAIAIQPDYAAAHNGLAAALFDARRADEALESSLRALLLQPELPETHTNLGNALSLKGRFDEAIAAYRKAIELNPATAEAHANLGNVLRDRGWLEEAIRAYGRAIAVRPDFAAAHSNLGNALRDNGQLDEAMASIRRAIELRPDYPEAYNNLANVLRDKGWLDEAIAACRRAIALRPEFFEAHSNLGNALKDKGDLNLAVAAYGRAIELKPDYAAAYSNRGVALKELGRLDEAIDALNRAIELTPDHAEVHNNLSSTRLAQGDHEGAIRASHQALELRPSYSEAHSNLLMCMQYQSGVTLPGLARAHAEWDERHAAQYRGRWKPWDLDRDPDRPLRLGFLSADLRRHPVGFFLARVVENLDPRSCAIVCYHSRAVRDAMSGRLAAKASEWHDVVGLSDDRLAAQIRADRIDILFDLAGHTADHRLLVFARRPAPIQISWMGYVGTTGLKAMDYLLADRFHVPPEAEAHYNEKVLRMPAGYVCYDPPPPAPAVGPLPALERGFVTFGSFNNAAKLTPEVLSLWSEIVGRVPGSRLLLVSPALGGAMARDRIGSAFEAAGGDRDRLELRGSLTWPDLLAAYNTVDVALDPFPYSGGVTTCEALWMGVPVVTCPGETFASRHSFSHLSNVGLTETIARDIREYTDLAVGLAGDLSHLAFLRAGLRDRMAGSPLCDGPRFAHDLQSLLRDVWRRWCRE